MSRKLRPKEGKAYNHRPDRSVPHLHRGRRPLAEPRLSFSCVQVDDRGIETLAFLG
jgi:hypothetical protein